MNTQKSTHRIGFLVEATARNLLKIAMTSRYMVENKTPQETWKLFCTPNYNRMVTFFLRDQLTRFSKIQT